MINMIQDRTAISWEPVYDHLFVAESLKWVQQHGIDRAIGQMNGFKNEFQTSLEWYAGYVAVEDLLDVYIQSGAKWLRRFACMHHDYPCQTCEIEDRTFREFSSNYQSAVGNGMEAECKLILLREFAMREALYRPRLILTEREASGPVEVKEGNSRLAGMIMANGISGYELPVFYGKRK